MHESLLKLYSDHLGNLQRRKVQQMLPDGYMRSSRKSYGLRESHVLKTSSTNYSGQGDYRFEKTVTQGSGGESRERASKQASYLQFKLPLIVRKEERKGKCRKIRAAVWGVIFIGRLSRQVRAGLLERKKTTQKCCKNLIVSIDRMVRGYYQKLLEKQLGDYMRILQKFLELPDLNQEKEILQNLGEIALKLATSTITRDMLEFLVLTSTNRAFFPSDYLAAMEMSRLEFCLKYGCVINVGQEQTRMLVGVGLGVKVFCFYVLYQPWRLTVASELVRLRWRQLTEVIGRVGSVFCCLIEDEFCLKLKETKPVSRTLLAQMGVRPIGRLDPLGKGGTETSAKHLIVGQSKRFLLLMQANYGEKVRGIRQNIYKWISRIAYICLKQSAKAPKVGADPFQSLRTIQSRGGVVREKSINSGIRVYRSVEMKKGPSAARILKKGYVKPNNIFTNQ